MKTQCLSCSDLAGLMCHAVTWWIADHTMEKDLDKDIYIFIVNVLPSLPLAHLVLSIFHIFSKMPLYTRHITACPKEERDIKWMSRGEGLDLDGTKSKQQQCFHHALRSQTDVPHIPSYMLSPASVLSMQHTPTHQRNKLTHSLFLVRAIVSC